MNIKVYDNNSTKVCGVEAEECCFKILRSVWGSIISPEGRLWMGRVKPTNVNNHVKFTLNVLFRVV